MKTRIVSLLVIAGAAGIASAQFAIVGSGVSNGNQDSFNQRGLLWDNGPITGENGIAVDDAGRLPPEGAFSYDDFEITDQAGWHITDYHTTVVNNGDSSMFSGVHLSFHNDNNGAPGSLITEFDVTGGGFSWVQNGSYFGRNAYDISADFSAVTLGPGTYWVDFQWLAADDGDQTFQMAKAHEKLSQFYFESELFGFPDPVPGDQVFGSAFDINYQLTGEIVPAPASAALLGLGGLVALRRRR